VGVRGNSGPHPLSERLPVRKTTGVALTLTGIGVTLLLLSTGANSNSELQVTRVIDGDTVVGYIDDKQETVRLIGVDAPETGACYALQAKKMLAHMTLGNTLQVETEKDKRDNYGRLLLNIYRDDGRLINEVLVSEGVAVQMAVAPNHKHINTLHKAEVEASRYGLGLHSRC